MTLVLATIASDSVVIGADSKIQVVNAQTKQPVEKETTTDRKLFKFAHVGIATYGSGPPEHVPTAISTLRPDCSIMDAVEFIRNYFQSAKDLGALIGGLDEYGSPILLDFLMSDHSPSLIAAEIGRPPPRIFRGIKNAQTDLNAPGTSANAIEQMLMLLRENAGASVGPPYEFSVIAP